MQALLEIVVAEELAELLDDRGALALLDAVEAGARDLRVRHGAVDRVRGHELVLVVSAFLLLAREEVEPGFLVARGLEREGREKARETFAQPLPAPPADADE